MSQEEELTILNGTVEQELTGDKPGSHDHPRAKAGKESFETSLLSQRSEAGGHRALRAVALINLRKQSVRGLDSMN
jgi:hypothetical protein